MASLLIASGADIKTVQARLRHATASTTRDIYGHLWPDADESTQTVIGAVIRDHLTATADERTHLLAFALVRELAGCDVHVRPVQCP